MQVNPRKLETRKTRRPIKPENIKIIIVRKIRIKKDIFVYFILWIFFVNISDIFIVRKIETRAVIIVAAKISASSLREIAAICWIADAAPVRGLLIR